MLTELDRFIAECHIPNWSGNAVIAVRNHDQIRYFYEDIKGVFEYDIKQK